ncbi:hypothetical protein ACLOJK_000515 [Asimina triloba]
MDSFNEASGFRYNSTSESMADADSDGSSGFLDIYVHHARNIHNICIYDKQDVYAKFSLTCSPDEALSTRIVNGGGKNPEFNENLRIKVTQTEAVLKCEIWMLSRVRNYLEDQLLGFALVPLLSVAGKGKMTQDFTLSSTDLFHSPAGTVKLTLALNPSTKAFSEPTNSSISSEVVLLDCKAPGDVDPVEYGRIEFPDINIVRQNQKMVSEYFDMAGRSSGPRLALVGSVPFLHLGASPHCVDDYDMTSNSPNSSIQNSGVFSSTTTSLSDDRNSADSKNHAIGESSNSQAASISTEAHQSPGASPDTPTSKTGSTARDCKESEFSSKEEEGAKEGNLGSVELGPVFTAPLGNINIEAEQAAMQQQIVDMYMRSMHQFTESLAKMKLPMDLDKPVSDNGGDVIQVHNKKLEPEKKKDSSRVFYGSRAFF